MLLAFAALVAGCSDNTQNVTSPSSSGSGSITLLFEGTLPPRGSSFYSFQVNQADIVSLTFASLTLGPRSTALTSVLGLGIGTPNGTGCDLTRSVNASPGLTSQLTTAMAAGTYCVKVTDIGNLTTPANFAVRIVQRLTTATTSSTSRTADTFTSTVAVRGASTHVFTVASPGTVNVTLTSVGPPTVPLGFGLGITGGPNACTLTATQVSAGGVAPQISQPVDPGTYCVQVYDVGNLVTPSVSFSMTIDFP